MTVEKAPMAFGWRVYGLGVVTPKDFPYRTALAYAAGAKIDTVMAVRLTRPGQPTFGVCAALFGGAHSFYLNLTIPYAPKWVPPALEFLGSRNRAGRRRLGGGGLSGATAARAS
jgi:hypothetical protein